MSLDPLSALSTLAATLTLLLAFLSIFRLTVRVFDQFGARRTGITFAGPFNKCRTVDGRGIVTMPLWWALTPLSALETGSDRKLGEFKIAIKHGRAEVIVPT